MDLHTCLKALNDSKCPLNVIEHSKAVSKKAVDIGINFSDLNKTKVDMEQVEFGAIIHDIGRSKTHTIKHAIVGAEILKNLNFPDNYVNITLKHIGAGIPFEEAKDLGLPPKDYMPTTIEEKIVAHADNLVNGTTEVDINFVVTKWEGIFGKNHPAISRIKKLHNDLLLF